MIARSLTRELPFNVPFKVKVSLIERFETDWSEHCLQCFEAVYTALVHELGVLVEKHFSKYGALLNLVGMAVDELVERQRRTTCDRIAWLLELEHPPFTKNSHYFASYRDKYLTKYKEARQVSN